MPRLYKPLRFFLAGLVICGVAFSILYFSIPKIIVFLTNSSRCNELNPHGGIVGPCFSEELNAVAISLTFTTMFIIISVYILYSINKIKKAFYAILSCIGLLFVSFYGFALIGHLLNPINNFGDSSIGIFLILGVAFVCGITFIPSIPFFRPVENLNQTQPNQDLNPDTPPKIVTRQTPEQPPTTPPKIG